jgi:ABC-type transport system involved in multi-copper enzyme maturation permease subunit
MRLLRSSLLKLAYRPATRRTFVVLAAFIALIYLAVGLSARGATGDSRTTIESMVAFPDANGSLVQMLLIFGGIAGAAYAGAVAASEWSWNTLRVALARGESRIGYVVSLFLAVTLLSLAAWIVLYLLGIGLVLIAAAIANVQTGNPFDPATLGRLLVVVTGGWWALTMEAAIGFGAAFVARSQVAGIAAVVGLFFVERFAELFLPADLLRLAPITAATSLATQAGKLGLDAALAQPLAVTTIYLVVAISAAAITARRAQVA